MTAGVRVGAERSLPLLAALAALPAQAPAPVPDPVPAAAALLGAFAPFDLDGDGRAEVRRLDLLAATGGAGRPLVVALVEARLWQLPALHAPLRRFAADVAADGFGVLLVAADVHAGPPHQDGRTVLGLRRLCQRLHAASPLAGVLLIGRFPDALLVRTCNWRRHEPLSLPGRDGRPVAIGPQTTNVRCVPEVVAHRCDLVLADLDGDWERRYVPGPATLRSATAVFGDAVPDAGGPCTALLTGELAVVDVFHVRDGAAIADERAFALHLDAGDRDRECTDADRARGNPLAQPEIAVSRIDARGIALQPVAAADGKTSWQCDPALELRLLVEYFDRNHAFRTKPLPPEQRVPASIAHELGPGLGALRAADPAWRDFAAAGHDVHGADLAELVRWLQRPAVLRTLRAHSDPWGAAFAGGGRADFAFYRELWAAGALPAAPFLLLHTGCEALSPPGAVEHAYDHPAYGQRAHAESILFFTPCLAIVGRAKVFYDEPRGFAAALGDGGTVGDAWRRYFEVESRPADWDEVGGDIGRKRAYFWSVVGDWTLRLPRRT